MNVSVTPILGSLREIYDLDDRMARYHAYVALLKGDTRGEPLPIGVFSPMGKRQPAFLDALLALDAEGVAARASAEAEERLAWLPDRYRVVLVVADVPRNGWTERHLTDADWRCTEKADTMTKSSRSDAFDRWVSVQLWTDEVPSEALVRRETSSAVYRAAHRRHLGAPSTLGERIRQEGRALAFAGATVQLAEDDLTYSREVIDPLRGSCHHPTCFAAIYGDEAARAVGYRPLGLSARAGLEVGLHEARIEGAPERWLRA